MPLKRSSYRSSEEISQYDEKKYDKEALKKKREKDMSRKDRRDNSKWK